MKKCLLSLLILFFFDGLLLGQEVFKIKGTVTDAKTREPMIEAVVVLTPGNYGTSTNAQGHFEITVPMSAAKGQKADLTANFVSYKKKTVKVTLDGKNITQDFALEEDIFQTQDVVVVGVASRTSKEVAEVAVSRISASELTEVQAYNSFSQLVTGKIAGVNMQTGSGNVGGGWRFFIRDGGGLNGNEQPIIYLDGIRLDNAEIYGWGVGGQGVSPLSNLNVNDIENVEVLKGPAAAASYGTNASNGVVLITTKRGKLAMGLGKGMAINYQFNYGVNGPSFKYNDNWLNKNVINGILDVPGYIQEHNIQISGGNPLLQYYTSFQNRMERGLIPAQNWMDRKSFAANISANPSENFSLNVKANYIWNKIARPNSDNNTWGWMLNALAYYPAFLNTDSAALAAEEDIMTNNQFLGSAGAMWKPIENLEIAGTFGVDYRTIFQDQYYPWGYKYGSNLKGYRYIWNSNVQRFSYEMHASYRLQLLEELALNAIIGTQLNDRKTTSIDGGGQFFNHPNITTLQTGDPNNKTGPSNSYGFSRDAGIYAETQFSWNQIYNWSFMIRRDYANAFGQNAPNIIYPRASFSIQLDKMGLIEFPAEIDRLKLRAGYGESGQLPGRLDGIPLTWTAAAGAAGVGITGNSLGNPKVEPERIKEYEIGFEAEFLRTFAFDFTYYSKNASKSIVYATLAQSYGFGGLTYPFNIGQVEGHGYEATLEVYPFKTVDYDLNLRLIWNYQTSKITALSENTNEIINDQNVEKVGWKKHQFYSIKTTTPVFDATGQLTNYNNTVNRVDCGNPIPDHSGSVSLSFRFLKNFNLYAFGEFGMNNSVYSYTIMRAIRAGSYAPANKLATQLGIVGKSAFGSVRKDPNVTPLTPGTEEYKAAANEFAKYMYRDVGNFIYPADYFAVREVSLSYDFTDLMKDYLANPYLTGLTAGFSARNLWRTSKYELDYEVNYGGGSGSTVYASDLGTLPQPRTYNFWVRVGL